MSNTKVILVTGSAKRVGAAIIRAFHSAGYRTIIHCRDSVDDANQLATELNHQRPDSAAVLVQDLTASGGAVLLARQALALYGRIDVLINNASSFYPTPVGEITDQSWTDLVGSNMHAPLFLSQALAPTLTQHHGAIINLIDVHANTPLQQHTLYCMAKAALLMMTKSLALELAPNVRVNGVAPGAILWPNQTPDQSAQEALLKQVPLGQLGRVEDIAATTLFLAKDAPYITGQVLAVDGGRSLGALTGA
ncbi:pteridine reductase [Ferrimonas lipolytica]|uniref:Pteridine reductase n=1 Tax=Ferrimonas lipolytica TaxID=2724191 RepID=A0A6H1UE76_9GAMM|nr:pteridine reductase [Ferrimonas lipolytica]QIZ76516.1 pteridine reductase [Ferrimonas lipolytica]